MNPERARWAEVNVALGVAALLVVVGDAESPIRVAAVLAFLLVSPGFAIAALVRIEERAAELMLVLAVSVALDILVPATLMYVGWWSPRGALLVLFVIVVAATLADALRFPPTPMAAGE
jgi:hypothetical protein